MEAAITPSILEFVTFLSAMLGYGGLAVVVLSVGYGHVPKLPLKVLACVIAIHVLLVWTFRYEWQLSQATRNGYTGFIIFHTALVLIGISTVLRGRAAMILTNLAFLIVTVGAVGAVFRYEVVSIYRIPVVIFAGLGGFGLVRSISARRPAESRD